MKTFVQLLCVMCLLGLVSSSFAVEPYLVGNFEDGPDTSETPWRYDHWFEDGLAMDDVTIPGITVTRGNYSLRCSTTTGGWGPAIQLPLFVMGNDGENPWIQSLLNPGAVFAADVTAFAADFSADWCDIGFARNTAAPTGGWDKGMWQPLIMDGQPHRYVFEIDEATRNAIIGAYGSWGANIGLAISTAEDSSAVIYVDNVWIYPDGPIDDLLPYDPRVEQEADLINEVTNVMLYWKAAADPNRQTGNPVHPDITAQYVFMSKENDPNLFYLGAAGVDLQDPASQYGPVTDLPFETTFYWVVVDALDGYEQVLTPGVSTIEDADPNNLIGPVWRFTTLSTEPQILVQPAHTRAQLGQPAQLTIQVSSVTPESYQWFYSTDGNIDDPGDNAISAALGGNTATFSIPSAAQAYHAYYYCRVTNDSQAVVYSNVVTLVVERKVGEYLFEGNLNDTGGFNNHGTAVNGAAAVAGDSVQGTSALSLNGVNQYVTLGTAAFPKASLLDAGGIGGGLDAGSILVWVKAGSTGTILANYNDGTATGFDLSLPAAGGARLHVHGDAGNGTTATRSADIVGDGQWHLLAVTWHARSGGQMHFYLDNTEVASVSMAVAAFSPWEYPVLLGAGRVDAEDRTVVGDFFGGLIDKVRIYNYQLTAEAIAEEYFGVTGQSTCINLGFDGSTFNVDNSGSSYCRVDLADFAVFAESWLSSGFHPVP